MTDQDAPFPSGEWIAVGTPEEARQPGGLSGLLAGRMFCVVPDGADGLHARWTQTGPDGSSATPVPGSPALSLAAQQAYGLIWLCAGPARVPLFSLPEYGMADGRVVPCGALSVRTSPLRAVENFLDLGHFPYVHTGILGNEPFTEVKAYRTSLENGELWARDCLFRQPKSAPGATEPAEVGYRYRVVSPLNVLLYKSAPAGQEGDDVICLFTQPLSETSFRAHLLMVLKDQTSPMAGMVAFQQLIFGQDKPILENQRPARLPLTGLTEKSVRADAMSLAYRRWLVELNWRYGAQYERG